MAYLHGKRLMELLGPSEEAFIRFVILADLMRYHSEDLDAGVEKYERLFTDEERDALLQFTKDYQGPKNDHSNFRFSNRKVIKGYRTGDIALFTKIKKKVKEDRHHVVTMVAQMDEAAKDRMKTDGFPANRFNVLPFTFNYQDQVAPGENIKVEPDDSVSKKRKLSASVERSNSNVCPCAMELDEDDIFDYGPNIEQI
jgi:hypothetical protein